MASAPRQSIASQLGLGFKHSPGAANIRVTAPESSISDRLGELSLTVEQPPLRIAPPGHESYVSLANVQDDPNQVLLNCEDEYNQERSTNIKDTGREVSDDDLTVVDPLEGIADIATRDVNMQSLIHKCLRMSVKHTKSATRDVRLLGLKSLRGQKQHMRLTASASSNMESDDEDDDIDDLED